MLVREVFISPLNHFIMHEEFVALGHGVKRKHSQESVESLAKQCSCFSYGRRSVGVAQHGMEGAGEVVGVVAAVVLLCHGHQAGKADEEQEEQLDGERSPEYPQQEGLALWGGRGGGGWRGDAVRKVRTGGNAASGAWWSAPAAGGHRQKLHTAENRLSSRVFVNHCCVVTFLIPFILLVYREKDALTSWTSIRNAFWSS